MPQWLAGEIGYALAIVGVLFLVREWFHVFDTQGNTLARGMLRAYLSEWRDARDTEHDTADDTRKAVVRRMQVSLTRMKDRHQRELFTGYVAQLAQIPPDDVKRLDELDRAFAVGTPIEEERKRPRRRFLMIVGAVLVVVGSLGQMVSTSAKPFGPFCYSKEWKCP